ncbi:YciI family protein [Lolliginicoccus levis]|uniref:YciI family protein n=1 Tax=Lolliginicoccus levis TaxID=2919542 RepID=UPI00241C67FF|nr:YciI family protein [Lolliginicoccus levis]
MDLLAIRYRYEAPEATQRDAHRPAHREWLRGQLADGIVVSAGAFGDGSGALILLDAAIAGGIDGARALLEGDPFVVEGLAHDIEVAEWSPVMGAFSDPA